MTPRCTGVILAGGNASRYGGAPKGLERVGGRRIIDRLYDALAPAVDEVLLIANHPEAAQWLPGIRWAADLRIGAGSLGGIHAALVHAATPVVLVAWDMPFVPTGLLKALRDAGASADVAVPESGSRRGVEPLCAYYDPVCVPAIERHLDAGDLRVVGFFDDVRVARLDADTVARFGDPSVIFMNVNSPDELGLAEEHASAPDGRRHRQKA